jgi:hypothetical protein
MSYQNTIVCFQKDGLDVKTTGATSLFTTPDNGKSFVPTRYIFKLNPSEAITVGPTISLGTNAASYNNLKTGSPACTTALPNNSVPAAGNFPEIAPGTQVFANITSGATGTSGTMSVQVYGYYI